MPQMQGVSHVALTVSDLAKSSAWYERLFEGAVRVMEGNEGGINYIVYLLPSGLVFGLREFASAQKGDRFAEDRVGLDHLSFACADRSALEEWERYLDDLGAQHSPIQDVSYGHVLVFRDPDNIQLEFFALP
jgi:glyoxylase I family protein